MNSIPVYRYRPNYDFIRCKCGGFIRSTHKQIFECDRCGDEVSLYQLEYDRLLINNKTGWIFPVKDRKE